MLPSDTSISSIGSEVQLPFRGSATDHRSVCDDVLVSIWSFRGSEDQQSQLVKFGKDNLWICRQSARNGAASHYPGLRSSLPKTWSQQIASFVMRSSVRSRVSSPLLRLCSQATVSVQAIFHRASDASHWARCHFGHTLHICIKLCLPGQSLLLRLRCEETSIVR